MRGARDQERPASQTPCGLDAAKHRHVPVEADEVEDARGRDGFGAVAGRRHVAPEEGEQVGQELAMDGVVVCNQYAHDFTGDLAFQVWGRGATPPLSALLRCAT